MSSSRGAGRRAYPGLVTRVGGLLSGLASLALCAGLLVDVRSALGVVGASLFGVCGVIVVGSVLTLRPDERRRPPAPAREVILGGEPARFHPRRAGSPVVLFFVILGLLGGWFAALGVVGTLDGTWLWAVLAAVPAVYFLAFVLFGLAGRLRPGGVWVTPTRLVDEHVGIRSEVALHDLVAMSASPGDLLLVPRDGTAVTSRPLVPRPWRRKAWPAQAIKIDTSDLAGGGEALATAVQQHLPVLDG